MNADPVDMPMRDPFTALAFPIAVVCLWIVTLVALSYVEMRGGLHGWLWRGDLDYLVITVLAGTPAFSAISLKVISAEGAASSGSWERHLRTTAVLYIAVIIGGLYLIAAQGDQSGSLGYGVITGLMITAAYAILVNTGVLLLLQTRGKIPGRKR